MSPNFKDSELLDAYDSLAKGFKLPPSSDYPFDDKCQIVRDLRKALRDDIDDARIFLYRSWDMPLDEGRRYIETLRDVLVSPECKICEGDGYIDVPSEDGEYTYKCDACDGSGKRGD